MSSPFERPGAGRRIASGIRIANVTNLDLEKKVMRAQLRTLESDLPEQVTVLHPAGFYSRPRTGDKAAAVVLSSGHHGSTRYAMLLGDVEQYPKMDEGDGILASPDAVEYQVRIKSDGTITVKGKNITVEGENVTVKGSKEVTVDGADKVTIKSSVVIIDADRIEAGGTEPLQTCGGGCTSKLLGG